MLCKLHLNKADVFKKQMPSYDSGCCVAPIRPCFRAKVLIPLPAGLADSLSESLPGLAAGAVARGAVCFQTGKCRDVKAWPPSSE